MLGLAARRVLNESKEATVGKLSERIALTNGPERVYEYTPASLGVAQGANLILASPSRIDRNTWYLTRIAMPQ